ncbi:MAG: multifunctional oxoglutarate decarboxylase/oxoglutarate dehydrogenase thiamine pyrophosphate-binding subunit/dihydrolipoyllysine-residue succinyltransferase subunit, partial [Actinobacteria bacterium]|nr:multifunctional oxoglutarate decarboxylase/oxoglutarate dehydrogenase thiamine pyrophosphate-binding subunit/dihydrolipoyllysine-residue succinyltransferase subunit [Actinomycetota bacterium]
MNTDIDLGPNSGLVEEMYRQYLENPQSVAESWREFFEDYQPRWSQGNGNGGPSTATTTAPARAPVTSPAPAPASVGIRTEPAEPHTATTAPVLDGEQPVPLRGAAARIVENMEASLGVPTATSLRVVPAKLLEVNRQILNNHLHRSGGSGKVSFTHLIAYAA